MAKSSIDLPQGPPIDLSAGWTVFDGFDDWRQALAALRAWHRALGKPPDGAGVAVGGESAPASAMEDFGYG
jgi:hypothetical protein